MLLEHTKCFPNSESSEIAQMCTYKHFKLPNAEPNTQFAPRTHRMLPEYDLFALRTPSPYSEIKRNGIRVSVIELLDDTMSFGSCISFEYI